MGKVTGSPKSVDSGKKPQDKRKKRRSRNNLDDLHRKLGKQAKGKDTRTDGNSGKERGSRRAANRILTRPFSGIYRNGAVGKEVRRMQTKLPLNDLNHARLKGDVMKLLQGYDANSEGIVIQSSDGERQSDQIIDSTAKEILQSTLNELDCVSPVLVKMDGKKRHCKEESNGTGDLWGRKVLSQMILEKKKLTNPRFQQYSAIQRYEELCATISAENFDRLDFPDKSVTDPLTTAKRKLRSTYAETFHNQFLRDMIKRGNTISERTPSCSTSSPILPEATYSSSGYGESGELVAGNVDSSTSQIRRRTHAEDTDSLVNSSGFLLSRSKYQLNSGAKEIHTPELLFSFSGLPSRSTADSAESKQERNLGQLNSDSFLGSSGRDHASLEVNCPPSHARRLLCSDMLEQQRSKTTILAQCKMSRESTIKRQVIKHRNQRTQTTGSLKRHATMPSAKIVHQEKARSMRHVPAILRRCSKANLFDEASLEQTKKRFEPVRADLSSSSTCSSDLAVRTCVIASPSVRQDEAPREEQLNASNIFSNRDKKIQKTVMFTRKDSRNAGHCLFTSDIMADRPSGNPSACLTRKDLIQQQDKCSQSVCTAHRSCQRATTNCHRSFCCSQVSEDSNYCSQELNEAPQLRPVHLQEPVFCEKLLLKKVHQRPVCENSQHCHMNNQPVCFVSLDEDSSDRQDYGAVGASMIEKSRTLQDGVCCHQEMTEVGLLKGVQNMQILPMEESRVKCNAERCIGKTLLVEEQPVKYLAIDNDSETQRVPIYIQKQPQFAAADNTDANYRLISRPAEYTQKILLVPTRDNRELMYVNEANLNRPGVSYERVAHPRKMLFYRPEQLNVQNASNLCEVHAPKQNVLEIANHGTILQQRDHEKRSRNTVEHTIVKDACAKSQTVYYKE